LRSIIRLVSIAALFLLGCVDEGDVIDPTPLEGTMDVEYPLDLWDKDVEGSSLLRLRINQEGAVDSVSILESSGYSAFDSSAVRAAKEMRFNPASRDGEAVPVWVQVPIIFTKTDRSPGR
jgi:protein TonB|tara:strand:+ start:6824 stop:7183 length:360 start_codon:yes stop_codon:yes gene_type:complete